MYYEILQFEILNKFHDICKVLKIPFKYFMKHLILIFKGQNKHLLKL